MYIREIHVYAVTANKLLKWILERSDKRSFCLAEATGVRCSLDKEPSPIQGGPLRTIYYKAHAASENAVSAVKLRQVLSIVSYD